TRCCSICHKGYENDSPRVFTYSITLLSDSSLKPATNSLCCFSTSRHLVRSAAIVANSFGSKTNLGETPFHRLSQIHSAHMMCTSVSRTEGKLLPISRVHSSARKFETASSTAAFAHQLN